MADIFCSYCNFTCQDDQQMQFLSHFFKNHSNKPNFHVYCNHTDCTKSFTKLKSLQKYWQRDHIIVNVQPELNNVEERASHATKRQSKPSLDIMQRNLFNNFIGAINYFKIISTISTGPKGKGANEAI